MIQENWTEERPYCIYKHTSPSGKVYIGQTYKKNLNDRWGSNGNGYKKCEVFERAIQKYGWKNFKHEILVQGLTKKEADEAEMTYIAMAKSMGISYNMRDGGTDITEADRERISKSLIGRFVGSKNPFYGCKHPNRGRTLINKDNTHKFVEKTEINKYLADGWEIGSTQYHKDNISKQFIGRIWIRKECETKQIFPEELDKYLSEGWEKGRISNEKWCKPCSDDKKQKIAAKNKGGVYINNGVISKHIHIEELDKYLSGGWEKGPLKHPDRKSASLGRIFINKDGKQKMVKPTELDAFLADGWRLGRK